MSTTSPQANSTDRRRANQSKAKPPSETRVRAKPIRPGVTYHISVATLEHRMFLSPDGHRLGVNQAFAAELARYASMFGLLVHGFVVMGNHYHLVATDPLGLLPDFKTALHGIGARMVNAERGRFGKMWSEKGSCDQVLLDCDDVMRSLVYDLTNPTAAELVKSGHRWPGATSYGVQWGQSMHFRASSVFRGRDANGEAETVELRLVRPNIFPELTNDELFAKLMSLVRNKERDIQSRLRTQSRRFAGESRIEKTDWNKGSRSEKARERFLVKPLVAATNTAKRVAYLMWLRSWRLDYATALASLRSGQIAAFPFGTYLMQYRANVPIAAPSSPA